MMPAAVTEPLSQPATGSPLEWQYTPRSITLNDCHLSGIRGPFQFNDQSMGQFPWTKTGAVQNVGGTSDVLLTGQRPDASGCVEWVVFLVHGPSGTATMSGGSRCPDGMRSRGFQTSGQVARLRCARKANGAAATSRTAATAFRRREAGRGRLC
jgi:hypothetical protein